MKEIIYQILPRYWGPDSGRCGRFVDIDGETLSYLKGLGVSYVWYTGVLRHATVGSEDPRIVKGEAGSPYAITDYYDVNPYLAVNTDNRLEEFLQLVERTHKAGLKVLLDFVPNHVSRAYHGSCSPEGIRPLGADDDPSVHWAPENDFFYYPGERLRLPDDPDGSYSEFPAKASGNCFSPAPALTDWYDTIRLNYCDFHTSTWDKMYAIVRFWAAKGIDGFRCDMVEMVPSAFFRWMISRIKQEFPDLLFVAEVYQKERYREFIEDVGFDLLYDKSGLYDTLRAVLCSGASAEEISWNWQFLGNLQPRMLNFLENHDEQRLASDFFAGKAENGYAALAVSLLLNDAPFMVYYGEEIGERGMDDEPFSGLNGRTTIFDWWKVASIGRLWNSVHGLPEGLTEGELSVLSRYREILSLAVSTPAFREGSTHDLGYCQGPEFSRNRVFAWLRYDDRDTYLIVANFSPEEIRTGVSVPYIPGCNKGPSTFTVTVPGRDYCILDISSR